MWKRIGKALLFPPLAVMLVLLPLATVFLVYAMVFLGEDSAVAVISYVLAAYTLTVWCMRIPRLAFVIRWLKTDNRYVLRWREDPRLRVNISLYGTLMWNTAYAVFQLGLGFYHRSFWYFSMAGYYILLAVMRYFLVRHSRRYEPGRQMREEWRKYRACGLVFLAMNLTLSLMIFFMVYWDRSFHHHEITTIAMAAYTFTTLAVAIVNTVRYRKYNSPVFSASKAISLTAACVSMLTLESTMLTTFGDGGALDLQGRRMMLGVSGGVVSVWIVATAICMIVQGSRELRLLTIDGRITDGQ